MTAEDIIRKLNLEPLPLEGGYFRRSYHSEHSSAIYYLMVPGSESFFHRLSRDEIWHYYAGDPAEQIQLHPDGGFSFHRIGPDMDSGESFQLLSPADSWQATRLAEGGRWGLFGTTMSPPYEDDDYLHGDIEELASAYPDAAALIREFF